MKRLLFVFVAGLLFSASAFSQVPVDWDWANFSRYSEADKSVSSRPRAVFMGDSITDNWARFDPEFFESNNCLGRGISGQVTSQMLVRFRADVINLNPRYVVILAGTNDLALNNGVIDIEHIVENIASMCEIARAHRIKPVICSVTPSARFGWRLQVDAPARIAELNGKLKEYAESARIPYVDYYSALVAEDGSMRSEYAGDATHPALPGYKVMEEIILGYLKK